ncbi:MAG: hypothetical protein ACLFVT_04225, partial [Syntrophobacteria bacterium]
MGKKPDRSSSGDKNVLDRLKSSFDSIPPKGDPGRRKFHFSIWYFLLALFAFSLIHDYFLASQVNT